jgi:hypothetical protein
MNRPCDLTGRRVDALDVTVRFESERHLDTKVDTHRLIPAFWVVIEEQVVSRAQSAIRLQEGPHLIERRLPCLGDTGDGHFSSNGCCLRRFHQNIISHGNGPSRREHRPVTRFPPAGAPSCDGPPTFEEASAAKCGLMSVRASVGLDRRAPAGNRPAEPNTNAVQYRSRGDEARAVG